MHLLPPSIRSIIVTDICQEEDRKRNDEIKSIKKKISQTLKTQADLADQTVLVLQIWCLSLKGAFTLILGDFFLGQKCAGDNIFTFSTSELFVIFIFLCHATSRLWDSVHICLVADIILEVEVYADVEFYGNIDVDVKDV